MVDVLKPNIVPDFSGNSVPEASSLSATTFAGDRIPFSILTGLNSIKDNLRSILFFRKGDYPDEPDFGVGLQDFLFENEEETFKIALEQEIRRQIGRFETRARIKGINVFLPKFSDDGAIIDLILESLGATFRLAASADRSVTISPLE